MSQSEFGHKLRRICRHGSAGRFTKAGPVPGRRTVRRDIPPDTTIELLWTGPGPGADDDI